MKWAREDPAAYKNTAHIMLLSAFITSVLAGRVAAVDMGDGWGTNLNSTRSRTPGWNRRVLAAVDHWLKKSGAPPLAPRLGRMCAYDARIGRISPYFTKRYGVNPAALVLAGTGDNPATLLGCGGGITVSLGSSYTVNGVMRRVPASPGQEYNIFGYTPGKVMALSCITNGGKLHEDFLRRYVAAGGPFSAAHWQRYAELAGDTRLGPDESLMLPYLMDESVPVRRAGIVRQGFGEDDAAANIRSLHVSQALSLRLHAGHLAHPGEMAIVGGGAANLAFRRLLTDLFGCRTFVIANADLAAPLGCAVAAGRHALRLTYAAAARRFVHRDATTILAPDRENHRIGQRLLKRYARLEKENDHD